MNTPTWISPFSLLPANAEYVVFNDFHDYIAVQGSYNPSMTGTYSPFIAISGDLGPYEL